MSDTLKCLQKRARELARSGKHVGWRSVAFELQFEPELKQVFWFHSPSGEQAFHWLHSPATKAEMTSFALRPGIPPTRPRQLENRMRICAQTSGWVLLFVIVVLSVSPEFLDPLQFFHTIWSMPQSIF